MSSQIRKLEAAHLIDSGEIKEISCSLGGETLAIVSGERVRFINKNGEFYPLEFQCSEVKSALVHPDGKRVIVIPGKTPEVVEVYSLSEARQVLSFTLDIDDEDKAGEYDFLSEIPPTTEPPIFGDPSKFRIFHLIDSANHFERSNSMWELTSLISERQMDYGNSLYFFEALNGLALHPDGRTLCVTNIGTHFVDLEGHYKPKRIAQHHIDILRYHEYGEGTHTVYFNDDGLLYVASTWISGNPYIEIECFDPEVREILSISEVWRERWRCVESKKKWQEVDVYNLDAFLPDELFPEGKYKAKLTEVSIEIWSKEELHCRLAFPSDSLLVPNFDLHAFVDEMKVAFLFQTGLEIKDLITGDKWGRFEYPFDSIQEVSWLQWSPQGNFVVFLMEQREIWLFSICDFRWYQWQIPEDIGIKNFIHSDDDTCLFVTDSSHSVWRVELPKSNQNQCVPRREETLDKIETLVTGENVQDESFLVYADALQEIGDPRGELIVLQHKLQLEPENLGIRGEIDDLISQHQSHFLFGEKEQIYRDIHLDWKLGFVRSARFDSIFGFDDVIAMIGHESTRFLEEIEVSFPQGFENDSTKKKCKNFFNYLIRAKKPRTLKKLIFKNAGPVSIPKAFRKMFPEIKVQWGDS